MAFVTAALKLHKSKKDQSCINQAATSLWLSNNQPTSGIW